MSGFPDTDVRVYGRLCPGFRTRMSAEEVKNRSGTDHEQTNPHARAREPQPLDYEQTATATPARKESGSPAPVSDGTAVAMPTVPKAEALPAARVGLPNLPAIVRRPVPPASDAAALAQLAGDWGIELAAGEAPAELRARLVQRQAALVVAAGTVQ